MRSIPIQTIKYAGSKARLLDFLIPQFEKYLEDGDLFVDLFSGTCSVSYALKRSNQIMCNDVQEYSRIIGNALIRNNQNLKLGEAFEDISPFLDKSPKPGFDFFTQEYAGTYFTKSQCIEIDNIRRAISAVTPKWKRDVYLLSLMHAMSYCASTTGHFAEFLDNKNTRSLSDAFFKKCDSLKIERGVSNNIVTCMDYRLLFANKPLSPFLRRAKLIYADPPYSNAQYSRFYHILETIVRYDNPKLTEAKAKYRSDRYFSGFCRASTVDDEFKTLIELVSQYSDATLAISYVNNGRGLISENNLIKIASNFYPRNKIKIRRTGYRHSTLGNKGILKNVEEFVIICES